jgi:hypothetical protein
LKVSKAGGKFLASPLPSNNIYIWKTSAGEKKTDFELGMSLLGAFLNALFEKRGPQCAAMEIKVNSPVHEAGYSILKGTVSQDEYYFKALKAHLRPFVCERTQLFSSKYENGLLLLILSHFSRLSVYV